MTTQRMRLFTTAFLATLGSALALLFLAGVHDAPRKSQNASAATSVPALSKEDRDAIELSKLQWLMEHPKANFCRMFKDELVKQTGITEPCLTDQQLVDLGLR
jgi:hypothetical protein